MLPHLALAAFLLAPHAGVQEAEREAAARTEIAAVLRSSRAKDAAEPALLSERMAALGDPAVEPIVGLLLARRIPPALEGEAEQILSLPQRDIALGALGRLDGPGLRAHVRARLLEPDGALERETALWVLGAIGTERDLDDAMERAQLEHEGEPARELAAALEQALTSILRRDPGAFASLPHLLRRAPRELQPALLLAVGEARDPRGLAPLVEALRWHPDLTEIALAQIPRVGRSSDRGQNAEHSAWIRADLDPARMRHPRATILALGALWDWDSAPRLIEILGSGPPELRDGALWALREMSGLELSADAAPWARWHDSDLAWHRSEGPRAARDLASGDRGRISRALREIRGRRLRRDELAELVWPLLEHRLAAVRSAASDALAALGHAPTPSGLGSATLLGG